VLTRHLDPRIVPLELWDLLVDDIPLYHHDRGASFGPTLTRGVGSLLAGHAVSESTARFPAQCRELREVVLVGGAARSIEWTGTLPARHAEQCVEIGGTAILTRLGARGLVIDLGQSHLKIHGARPHTHPRDFHRVPISQRPVEGRGRAELIDFVATALREAADETRPEALVLALPCEISANGTLGTCSYPWTAGDPIVAEILAAADLTGLPGVLLNDAELAAIGVAEAGPVAAPALVLTVGFGIGAAIVLRSEP
jgi:hypothetical protein